MRNKFGCMAAGGKGSTVTNHGFSNKGPKNKRKAKQRIAKERARMERMRRMEARAILEEKLANENDY